MNSNSQKRYFKITNKDENHNGFQYVDGLNILDKPFEKYGSCVPGGLYFTDIEHIFEFLQYGIYLREVILPTDDKDFEMVADEQNKYRANKIILGKRYDLNDSTSFKYLVENGADVKTNNNYALRWASRYGHLDVVKYLVENSADVKTNNNSAVRLASEYGHLDVVKYLVENGADIKANNNYAVRIASKNGHLDVVKYLVENGADLKADNNSAVGWASRNGHLDVVKYLVENDADIKAENNY